MNFGKRSQALKDRDAANGVLEAVRYGINNKNDLALLGWDECALNLALSLGTVREENGVLVAGKAVIPIKRTSKKDCLLPVNQCALLCTHSD